MRYTITKSLKDLPPLQVKTIKVTSTTIIDFISRFNAICVNLNIHNHGGANATYKLNDSSDTLDVRATTGQESFENCHIEKIEVVTVTDVDLICIIAPIPLLKQYDAVESS